MATPKVPFGPHFPQFGDVAIIIIGETLMSPAKLLALFLFLLYFIPAQAAENPTQQLHSLFDRDWEYQMRHDPIAASVLGDRRWNDQWPVVSLKSLQEQSQNSRQELQQLSCDQSQFSQR
ncbi:MAG TPA: hypothetical protein VLK33_01985 [Terriglobales bacterium]|nr:hypothetical protein [Terriglobales bacterium]